MLGETAERGLDLLLLDGLSCVETTAFRQPAKFLAVNPPAIIEAPDSLAVGSARCHLSQIESLLICRWVSNPVSGLFGIGPAALCTLDCPAIGLKLALVTSQQTTTTPFRPGRPNRLDVPRTRNPHPWAIRSARAGPPPALARGWTRVGPATALPRGGNRRQYDM